MNAIAEKLHLLETVAPNDDALPDSMLDKALNDHCSFLDGDKHG